VTAVPDASSKVVQFIADTRPMLVGGEWVEARDGRTFDSVDPGTGNRLATVARGAAADIDRAVDAAADALRCPAWRRMLPAERQRLLWRL